MLAVRCSMLRGACECAPSPTGRGLGEGERIVRVWATESSRHFTLTRSLSLKAEGITHAAIGQLVRPVLTHGPVQSSRFKV
ncbi:MAG: hypothetical protein RMK20_10375, partial [Verrucomicrobiales bacterium]|nr:hypothetical protein [Verrucomicrobiales bacterium]